MILHAENRMASVAESLQSLIVQIDVRQLDVVLIQRIRIDREAVVLRGDLDFVRLAS